MNYVDMIKRSKAQKRVFPVFQISHRVYFRILFSFRFCSIENNIVLRFDRFSSMIDQRKQWSDTLDERIKVFSRSPSRSRGRKKVRKGDRDHCGRI